MSLLLNSSCPMGCGPRLLAYPDGRLLCQAEGCPRPTAVMDLLDLLDTPRRETAADAFSALVRTIGGPDWFIHTERHDGEAFYIGLAVTGGDVGAATRLADEHLERCLAEHDADELPTTGSLLHGTFRRVGGVWYMKFGNRPGEWNKQTPGVLGPNREWERREALRRYTAWRTPWPSPKQR